MPLPKPRSGESQNNFIGRCLANPTMNEEYPDDNQRTAVCYSLWENKEMTVQEELLKTRKFFISARAKTIDREKRTMEIIATEKIMDRDGDIVEPMGAMVDNYLNNGVILAFHDRDRLPIAKCLSLEITENRVKMLIQFKDRGEALEIFEDYAEGYMNTWSMGFVPLPGTVDKIWSEPDEDGEAEFIGFHFKEWELLEVSAVPVPANPNAITLSKSLDEGMVKNYLKENPAFHYGTEEIPEEVELRFELGMPNVQVIGKDGMSLAQGALKKTLSEQLSKIKPEIEEVKSWAQIGYSIFCKPVDVNEKEIKQVRAKRVVCRTLVKEEETPPKGRETSDIPPEEGRKEPKEGKKEALRPGVTHRLKLLEAEMDMIELERN